VVLRLAASESAEPVVGVQEAALAVDHPRNREADLDPATDAVPTEVDVCHRGVDTTAMSSDVDAAAGTVIELTNTIGATAAGLQNTTQTARAVRRAAAGAARHPGRLAALGLTLLATSGVLALRRPRPVAPRSTG
jgi:hypothetical protein